MKRNEALCELDIDEINGKEYGTEFYQKDVIDDLLNNIEERVGECYDLLDKITHFSNIDDVKSKLDDLKADLY